MLLVCSVDVDAAVLHVCSIGEHLLGTAARFIIHAVLERKMFFLLLVNNLFAVRTYVSTAEKVLIISACAVHFTQFAMLALEKWNLCN